MGTVSKALELLDYFTHQRPLIGLSDLARLSGLNKATCFRLMSDLGSAGLVEQVGAGREYRIGAGVLRLAALREAHVPTRETAMPVLQRLADTTGETAHLSLVIAGRLVTLAFAYSAAHGTRVMMEDADTLPWHATSSGHAVLAFLPKDQREALLAAPLAAVTGETVTDTARLLALLEKVRKLGMAETAGTFESDVESCAVPLFDATGAVIGALGTAAPALRLTPALRAKIRSATLRAAIEILHLWGGHAPAAVSQSWADLARSED